MEDASMNTALDIEQIAARWLLRREQPDWTDADEIGLEAWLDESFAHKAAYWRLEHGWRAADRLGAIGPSATASPRPWWRNRRVLAIAATLVLTCCLGAITMLAVRQGADQRIRVATAIGERREIALADGSHVTLNTDTALRAAIVDGRRRVWLDRGEAFFDVVHEPTHPFIVVAGGHRVTVLGTAFSVRRESGAMKVAVERGAVRIDDDAAAADARGTVVAAGDIAIARGRSVLLAGRSETKVEDALSWRNGTLTFDQVTLAEAAAEFNRYNRRQIRFGDAQAAEIRIGGSFEAGNIDAFAHLLHEAFGLRIRDNGSSVTISS